MYKVGFMGATLIALCCLGPPNAGASTRTIDRNEKTLLQAGAACLSECASLAPTFIGAKTALNSDSRTSLSPQDSIQPMVESQIVAEKSEVWQRHLTKAAGSAILFNHFLNVSDRSRRHRRLHTVNSSAYATVNDAGIPGPRKEIAPMRAPPWRGLVRNC